MAGSMQEFIHAENLKRYRKQLAETSDETRRLQIQRLLSEEEARDLTARPLHLQ